MVNFVQWSNRYHHRAHRLKLEKEKAERLRKRAELKAQRQEEHEKRLESLRAAKTATKAVRRRRIAERLTRRREAQQVWLKLLEEDSKHWIPEDKIDDMITEDTFSMRYPWQYEDYFAVTQRRKLREELYRRGDFTALEAEVIMLVWLARPSGAM